MEQWKNSNQAPRKAVYYTVKSKIHVELDLKKEKPVQGSDNEPDKIRQEMLRKPNARQGQLWI